MKTTASDWIFFVLLVLILGCMASLALAPKAKEIPFGTAGELNATVATTSNPTVNTTPSLVFATSTCGARVISTTASPIMITFSDVQGSVPSATFGTYQAASTTVTYGNGSFGCGAYRVYSFVAGTITVMESK